jgi:riboflavin biosynthesis pyrimidine reductase
MARTELCTRFAAMLRTLKEGDSLDVLPLLFADQRRGLGHPWVMLNMVASVDGATALKGGATALNDPDDRGLFLALRSVADVVLMGAQTIRSEKLGPVRMSQEMLEHREGAGLEGIPRLAVLTRSLDIEPDHRIFSESATRPILVVPGDADPTRVRQLESVAEIAVADTNDGRAVIDALNADVVLCEGGPSINSLLIAAGVVDEINLTLSPLFGLGSSKRIASHADELDPPQELVLDRALIGDRSLFLRYVRAADEG